MLIRKHVFQDQNNGGEGGGGGDGGAGGSSNAPAPSGTSRESFSREYVHELREENKAQRLARQEAEKKAQEAIDQAKKAKDEADGRVSQAQQAANERIIRAELKAEAVKAGVVDLDVLKLVDLSKLKINDQGEVEGGAELIKQLKESKPHFFGASNSTEKGGTPPKGDNGKPKKVSEMTAEERKAEAKKRGFEGF